MVAGRDTGPARQVLAYRANPDLPGDADPRQSLARDIEVEPPTRPPAVASRALAPEPAPPEMAVNVPRPPQRPLDLDTIPDAATPVRGRAVPVAERPPARPIHAGLFFAAADLPAARFTKDDPFKDLKPQRFVALKGQP
jgi:rare lipoprotein A